MYRNFINVTKMHI